jgi:N-acylneuraminate cytidylyltransferase
MAPSYRENGSIYVFTRELFRRTGIRLGGRIRQFVMNEAAGLDIDSELDFRVAEALLAAGEA